MKELQDLQEIINVQQERCELEFKANSIPYINPRQVEVYKNLLKIGFKDEGFRLDENNCVIITVSREVVVWLNPGKTVFNGHFISLDNHNLDRISSEDLEIVIKNIKQMFDTIFKK